MTGWESNANPGSFLQADLDEAAERLAAILRAEQADVLTTYDWHGNYGHPDHIRVHQVGHRAAVLAGTPAVYEATLNRDAAFRGIAEAVASGEWVGDAPDVNDTDDGEPFGTPEAELTTAVDVSDVLDAEAGRVRGARQPGDRHRVLPADAPRRLPQGVRHRVVPARGRPGRPPRGLARPGSTATPSPTPHGEVS